MKNFKHTGLTERVIQAFYRVYGKLGYGFLEKVYERAMMIELRDLGIECHSQAPIYVFYNDQQIGDYYADIMVENTIIVELKSAEEIRPEHKAQLLNYLKATTIEVGLVLNFGPKPGICRKAFDNEYK